MPRRKRPAVGSVVHAARCQVCDTWTTIALDLTVVLLHKEGCTQRRR